MKSKTDRTQKNVKKANTGSEKRASGKISSIPKIQIKEEDDDDPEEKVVKKEPLSKKGNKGVAAPKKIDSDTDDGDNEDIVDDWDKVEEDMEWDADFEEFDLPKSKGKKSGSKKGGEEDDDFKLDDEFKDIDPFNDRDYDDDDDDY